MSNPEQRLHWVGHADLDAFYASVEERDNPAYRDHPVVVGAMPGGRGVVSAANYRARAFGIHSAMPIADAYRRCPDAIYLRPDMAKYIEVSREIFALLEELLPVVEPVSIDEAYLDLNGLERLLGTPEAIGETIKQRIFEHTGLRASVGIGPNRLIAKLASEHRKPDGLVVVHHDRVLDFLAPMPVANLRGVGRQTQKRFEQLGIRSVAQLRAIPLPYLQQAFGVKAASSFHRQAFGIASHDVVRGRQRKSISKETTFSEDLVDSETLKDVLRELAVELAATARREQLAGKVVTLKIRFSGFETHTRQQKLTQPTNDERVLLREAWRLMQHSALPRKPVRLIGVGISDWDSAVSAQVDLFEAPAGGAQDQRLLGLIDEASERFGKGMLRLGSGLKSGRRNKP